MPSVASNRNSAGSKPVKLKNSWHQYWCPYFTGGFTGLKFTGFTVVTACQNFEKKIGEMAAVV
jgi:hypothetical protein